MQANHWTAIGAMLGAAGIAIGAFGAHGLEDRLAAFGYEADEVARRLDTFETGARYQMYTAFALLAVGFGQSLWSRGNWSLAGWLLLIGGCWFSGLLYALTFAGPDYRWLGAVVPLGGLAMIAGWAVLAIAAWRSPSGKELSNEA